MSYGKIMLWRMRHGTNKTKQGEKRNRVDLQKRLDDFEVYLNTATNAGITTVKKYRSIVRLFLYDSLGKIENSDGSLELTIGLINTWISEKNRTKSTAHYKYAIRHFLISLGRKDLSNQLVPAKRMKRKKTFKFVNKDTLQRIINTLPSIYRPLAFLQVKTGARVGSILTLRAENVDYNRDDKLIYIVIGVNKTLSKRSKEHVLRLSQKYTLQLKSWITRPFGFIFLESKCESMTEGELITHVDTKIRYFNKELEQAARIHGVDGFSSHYLRHLFADYFLKAGGDPVYLQKALGHAKLETTLQYVSIGDKLVDKTILAMED